ncbi:MAG TPA: hypothetical protein VGR57_13135, partial [Ktedonobacterales bacterium]|nr:hypothetical protein [Ktedonobacterales bacterium]
KLGGAAAVAGVAAGAAALANHAYAAPATVNNWTTSTFTVDAETIVKPSSSGYTPPDILQVQLGTGTVYEPLGTPSNAIKAAVAAYDTTTNSIGVYGTSSTGFGLFGITNTGTGATGAGLNGTAITNGTGVSGNSGSGIGIQGNSVTGLGGTFTGGQAPIALGLGFAPGAPTSGTHVKGEVYLDVNAVLWTCVAGGAPGMWVKPGVNLLPAPIRIFDSRPSSGAPLPLAKGTLGSFSTTMIQVTGTDVGGIHVPAGASGVIGNLTVTGTTGPGDLILFPTGAPQPNTSNINYSGGQTVANFANVGLSTAGQMNLFVHVSATNAIFDVAGFVF